METARGGPPQRRLVDPDGTVQTGCFEQPCDDLSVVSRPAGGARVLQRVFRRMWSLRPPQFFALTVANPRMFLMCELSRFGRLVHAHVHVVDRASGLFYEWALHRGAGRNSEFPTNVTTGAFTVRVPGRGSISVDMDVANATRWLRLDFPAGSGRGVLGQQPRLLAEYQIRMNGTSMQPYVRADLLSGGRIRYTHKAIGLPAGGFVDCGEIQERGDVGTAVAGFDWILGDHPHVRPRLSASATAADAAERPLGFVLTAYPPGASYGRADADCIRDCVVWLRGERIEVNGVRFAHNPRRTLDPWIVRDADGLLDLSFTPDGEWKTERRYRRHYALVTQPYGAFAGELRTPEGKRELLHEVYGVVETTRIRR